jgi:hypothetical protein
MESKAFEPGVGEAPQKKGGTAMSGPGLGRLDGIRRDVQRAKENGVAYDPRGTGRAWTHDFLNKKPWHPSSFRNQVRVWEAQQEELEKEKKDKRIREEYLAEKEYEKQLLLLEHGEAFRERHSVAFLYQKPPGYRGEGKGGEKRDEDVCTYDDGSNQLVKKKDGEMDPSSIRTDHKPHGGKRAGKHVEKVIHGFQAVMRQQQDRMELKRGLGMMDRAPEAGSISSHDYVFAEMDSEDEEMAYALATGQPMVSEKERRRQVRRQEREARREERKKVKAAKEVLKQAGIDAEKLFDHGASSLKRRKRRHRKVE